MGAWYCTYVEGTAIIGVVVYGGSPIMEIRSTASLTNSHGAVSCIARVHIYIPWVCSITGTGIYVF